MVEDIEKFKKEWSLSDDNINSMFKYLKVDSSAPQEIVDIKNEYFSKVITDISKLRNEYFEVVQSLTFQNVIALLNGLFPCFIELFFTCKMLYQEITEIDSFKDWLTFKLYKEYEKNYILEEEVEQYKEQEIAYKLIKSNISERLTSFESQIHVLIQKNHELGQLNKVRIISNDFFLTKNF